MMVMGPSLKIFFLLSILGFEALAQPPALRRFVLAQG
jgi:hypothetical protein